MPMVGGLTNCLRCSSEPTQITFLFTIIQNNIFMETFDAQMMVGTIHNTLQHNIWQHIRHQQLLTLTPILHTNNTFKLASTIDQQINPSSHQEGPLHPKLEEQPILSGYTTKSTFQTKLHRLTKTKSYQPILQKNKFPSYSYYQSRPSALIKISPRKQHDSFEELHDEMRAQLHFHKSVQKQLSSQPKQPMRISRKKLGREEVVVDVQRECDRMKSRKVRKVSGVSGGVEQVIEGGKVWRPQLVDMRQIVLMKGVSFKIE